MKNFGFPIQLVDSIVCPVENLYTLNYYSGKIDGGVIKEGQLICPKCKAIFEIKAGILCLLNKQNKLDNRLYSEINLRDQQAHAYDQRLSARFFKEVKPTLNSLKDVKDKYLIEYGCGTGRFTLELLHQAKYVLGVDFSWQSLLLLASKADANNLGLVLADATQFKTKEKYFDFALAAQFFEHIPSIKNREKYLSLVSKTLTDRGVFICTAYNYDLRKKIAGGPAEGLHGGKIFYHYFTKEEVINEFRTYFGHIKVKPIDITLPLEARLNLPIVLGGYLSNFMEKVPFLNKFGHLLLIESRKRPSQAIDGDSQKRMGEVSYRLPTLYFRKYWFWFVAPRDIVRADMVNFFSYDNLEPHGFHKKEGLTTIIDLSQSLEEICDKMRPGFIRKQISKGEKNGIIVRQDNNFESFKKVYYSFRKKKKLHGDKFIVFKKNGLEFSAYWQGEMVAGGIFIAGNGCIRALVLASPRLSEKNGPKREIVGQANRLVIWEAIKYAKKNNFKIFDLGGIDPKSKDQGQKTLAEFKEAFGGVRKNCYYYYKIYSKLLNFFVKLKN